MKKRYSFMLAAAAWLGGTALLNKLVFMSACSKKENNTNLNDDENFFNWKHGKIHYTVCGNGKPLLLLHGMDIGASHIQWQKNISSLSESYRVYAIDMLGFGFSDKPRITYTSYIYALLINDFIDEIIGKPVAVAANGPSCSFALKAYKLKPENFKKFIFIEPLNIISNSTEKKYLYFKKLIETNIIGTAIYNIIASKYFLKSYIIENVLFAQERYNFKELVDERHYMAHFGGSAAKYAYASAVSNFINVDLKSDIKDIKLPIHIIWGEGAKINPISNMEVISKIKKDALYTIFEETKLLPQYENATEFNKLVKEFLK